MIVGFLLDLLLGDPDSRWHPIAWIGRFIAACERWIRPRFPATPTGERLGGAVLAMTVMAVSAVPPALLLMLCIRISPWLALVVNALLCWLLVAIKSLRMESLRVYGALQKGDLPAARRAVSRIVGRDTQSLTASQVAGAAVETVAESTVDGILSPLFYIALGFAPLGFLFKAVSTLDSMIGYRNDRYQHFGTFAARLDDALNFLPARAGGALMCVAAFLSGANGRDAWRIFRRDRLAHASPNSAHTEAACAGALGLTLGGDASYFGVLHHKPTQGDGRRPEAADILRANRLTLITAVLGIFCALLLRAALYARGGWIWLLL